MGKILVLRAEILASRNIFFLSISEKNGIGKHFCECIGKRVKNLKNRWKQQYVFTESNSRIITGYQPDIKAFVHRIS